MPEQTRTTVYLQEQDRQRLARLKERYGLGVSAAVRAGLALLERQMDTALMREAKERDDEGTSQESNHDRDRDNTRARYHNAA